MPAGRCTVMGGDPSVDRTWRPVRARYDGLYELIRSEPRASGPRPAG